MNDSRAPCPPTTERLASTPMVGKAHAKPCRVERLSPRLCPPYGSKQNRAADGTGGAGLSRQHLAMRALLLLLLQLVLHLGERRHRAFFVEVAAGCAAHADPTDRRAVRLDGHAADSVGDVWQRRLRN